ncbi:MAG TPA: hypothetical protein VFN67_29450 [Polyangiales bacterium]|nr:hypothetical protein [Polyangiales bacterium]
MRLGPVCAGLLFNVVVVSSVLAEDPIATAPAAAARPNAEPEAEPPAPVTAVGPGPAYQPDAPAPAPAPPEVQPRRFKRWTPEEIARVRAALARQRKEMLAERPRIPGDPHAHFTLGLEISGVARPDTGFDRFELGRISPRFGLFAAYDLVPIREELTLFVELGAGFEHDEADGLLGLGTSGELSSQTLHAGLGLRWDALSWLSPQVRLWGGASLFQLDVSGTNVAFDTGYATSVFGALGAGFLVHLPPRTFESRSGSLASLQLGLLVEAGYALRSDIDFRLRTQPDPRRIEVIDASLGNLSLSGGYIRFALVVRF